jgi:hypothetical protein
LLTISSSCTFVRLPPPPFRVSAEFDRYCTPVRIAPESRSSLTSLFSLSLVLSLDRRRDQALGRSAAGTVRRIRSSVWWTSSTELRVSNQRARMKRRPAAGADVRSLLSRPGSTCSAQQPSYGAPQGQQQYGQHGQQQSYGAPQGQQGGAASSYYGGQQPGGQQS